MNPPPESERPNLRTGPDGQLIVDLKDGLSAEEELKRLDEIMEIVDDSENLKEAQERIDERVKD